MAINEIEAEVHLKLIRVQIQKVVRERLGSVLHDMDDLKKVMSPEELLVAGEMILTEVQAATEVWIVEMRERLNKKYKSRSE